MAPNYERYRFTVQQFDEMGRAGIFDEDARVELLDGQIVTMTPMGDRQAETAVRVTEVLYDAFWGVARVYLQNPVRLGLHSEPQPDVAVVRRGAGAVPRAEDVLLLVEVEDPTLETDRRIKIPFYGRAGVPEVWLLDLRRDVVEVYRNPTQKGYLSVRVARRGERIASEALPDRSVAVGKLLPEPEGGGS